MEDSKAQQKIMNLGKAIVKELELEPGVDTLAKWMSHYLAEKIELAKKLTGKAKQDAQKECFEIILELWKHRWSAPGGNSFLKDFEPLFEILEKLNPNKETPFFIPPQILFDFQEENEKETTAEVKSHLEVALMIDRLARSLICDSLNQFVSELNLTVERKELIRNAIENIDHPDMRIIRIVSDHNKSLKSQEDDDHDKKKEQIEEIQKRIKDLEEFTYMKDSLLDRYKKQLSEIEK